jgi:hypothetical protein
MAAHISDLRGNVRQLGNGFPIPLEFFNRAGDPTIR